MRFWFPHRAPSVRALRTAWLAALLAVPMAGIAPAAHASTRATWQHLGRVWLHSGPQYNGTHVALPPPSACAALFNALCYGPAQIRAAYNIPATLDGTGQTIVIMEDVGYPNIRQDVHVFDQQFGLPDPKINIFYPNGVSVDTPSTLFSSGVSGEEALDVEWSHAIAPAATIDVVISSDDYAQGYDGPGSPALSKMYAAEQFAVSHHLGNQMSVSYGFSELNYTAGATDPNVVAVGNTFAQAVANKMSVFISTGDQGANNIGRTPNTAVASASFQVDEPNVTGVGGTSLFLNDNGTRNNAFPGGAEQVWGNDSNAPVIGGAACVTGQTGTLGATGGSPSAIFTTAPSYQTGLASWTAQGQTARTISDVSFDANQCTAPWVYIGPFYSGDVVGHFFGIGGTSYSAPAWAGIAALINQSRANAGKGPIGFLNPPLYAIAGNPAKYASDFFDITTGDNKEPTSVGGAATVGFAAGPGYDMPTGLGSPNVANLIADLTALP